MVKDFMDIFNDGAERAGKEIAGLNRFLTPVPADIAEAEDKFVVTMNVAGYSKEEVSVSYKDGFLTISGETSKELEEVKYHLKERTSSSFSRSFRIENIKEKEISAKMENGVIEIALPKDEVVAPSKIEIQ